MWLAFRITFEPFPGYLHHILRHKIKTNNSKFFVFYNFKHPLGLATLLCTASKDDPKKIKTDMKTWDDVVSENVHFHGSICYHFGTQPSCSWNVLYKAKDFKLKIAITQKVKYKIVPILLHGLFVPYLPHYFAKMPH